MTALLQDLRYALRGLARTPGFSVVAVLVLALGIGANTAIFSVVDAAFFKPMPFPESNRLVRLSAAHPQGFVWFNRRGVELWPAFQGNRAFKDISFYRAGGVNLGRGLTERRQAAVVTADFFRVLDVQPSLGRTFTAADLETTQRVAVISDRLWRTRFGGDRGIIAQSIMLDGQPFDVLGVMPAGQEVPSSTDVWVPNGIDLQLDGEIFFPTVIARLGDGVTAAAAREEVQRIAREESKRHGSVVDSPAYLAYLDGIRITPLRQAMLGDTRPILLLIVSAAILVLLVACVNAASLLLTRLASRQREFLVRRALGASEMNLTQQVLCESVLLSLVAGILTLPITYGTLGLVSSFVPVTMYGASDIAIDARTFAATLGFSLLAAVIFSMAPSFSIRGLRSSDLLKGSATATVEPFWRRFRSVLVIGQIAVAVVLLACAVTVVRTVGRLIAVDLGARGDHVVVLDVTLPRATYGSPDRVREFSERMDAGLRAVPGVGEVATANGLPGEPPAIDGAEFYIVDEPQPPGREYLGVRLSITPAYFKALGINMVAGRPFTAADNRDVPPVVIVSEQFARNLKVRAADIIGRRAILNHRYVQIVGVVKDVRLGGPERGLDPAVYVPFAQQPIQRGIIRVVVKTQADPTSLIPAIRAAASAVDPAVPAFHVRTFDQIRETYLAQRRFVMNMMLAFGGLAALLGALGLYGVVSYLVQLQTREIGIRMALGAPHSLVRFNVLRSGVLHGFVGVIIGSALAASAVPLLSTRIPNLGEIDPASLATLAIAGVAISALAAWLPARRATAIDPVQALRAE